MKRKMENNMIDELQNLTVRPIEEHDPVCGMKVNPSRTAASLEYQGATVYFCSAGCAAKFRAAPEKYIEANPLTIDSRPPAKAASNGEYTCPMHPEIKHLGPGSCPRCGMALEPAMPSPPATGIEYTCPMHPQIVRNAPGTCPICGMTLEPRGSPPKKPILSWPL